MSRNFEKRISHSAKLEIVVAILVNSRSEKGGDLNLLAQRIARRFIH